MGERIMETFKITCIECWCVNEIEIIVDTKLKEIKMKCLICENISKKEYSQVLTTKGNND